MKAYARGVRVTVDQLAKLDAAPSKSPNALSFAHLIGDGKDTPDLPPASAVKGSGSEPQNGKIAAAPASAGSAFLRRLAQSDLQSDGNAAADRRREIPKTKDFESFAARSLALVLAAESEHRFDADRIAGQLALAMERAVKLANRMGAAGAVAPLEFMDRLLDAHPNPVLTSEKDAKDFEKAMDVAIAAYGKMSGDARKLFAEAVGDAPKSVSEDGGIELASCVGNALIELAADMRGIMPLHDPEKSARDAM